MDISTLLQGSSGKDLINQVSKGTGVPAKDAKSVIDAALPALFGALQNNAAQGGAPGILQALNTKHDGSLLDNLSNLLNSDTEKDGLGILKHVLGGKQNSIQQALSEKTGVSAANVGKILTLLAPVVMGYLGKQKNSKSVKDENGLGDLLGNLMGSLGKGSNGGADLLGDLLGNLTDEAAAKSKKSTKGKKSPSGNAGGLGSLLNTIGGLFGKRG